MFEDPSRLSPSARALLESAETDLHLSAASAWEITVKVALGKLILVSGEAPADFIPRFRDLYDIASLPIEEHHLAPLPQLPALHKDPFDRLLVCQALADDLTIVTPDRLISQYPVKVVW